MAKFMLSGAIAFLCLASAAFSQDIPGLAVTPSSATVLLGDERPFRAVGRDGRPGSAVRWDGSSSDMQISGAGAEVMVYFRTPGEYVINAYSPDGSGSAKIKVVALRDYPNGAKKWTVDSFAGCRTKQIIPAVPAPGSTNDVFMSDVCPRGNVVRALTAEGLENWRTWVSGKDADPNHLEAYAPKDLLGKSLCDSVKIDMSREDVLKAATAAKADLPDSEKAKDVWTFEEGAGECRVTFKDGKVAKKQKVIGN
jgi:hypothetical protein